jgi:6-phosphofructokinase 1
MVTKSMKRIAVLTSGGDAPGMNAATRAVVRLGVLRGHEMFGVRHGYTGLVNAEFVALGPRDVGGIIHQGGTMLGTSRCEAFRTAEGQRAGLAALQAMDIAALVVIGGNGSQTGAYALAKLGFPVVGIASTIDNDLAGTDITIGATTAIDIALEAIDRLRVTAASHERAFLVEVMGRHCGYLAANVAIAGGAEAVVVPEMDVAPEDVAQQLRAARQRGKSHAIIVVAEGARLDAQALAAYFRTHAERLGFDLRTTQLGHTQRGGTPGSFDRILATQLGVAAIDAITAGESGVLIGWRHGAVCRTPLAEVAGKTKPLDLALLEIANSLAY